MSASTGGRTPLVSIVVPTLDAERFIADALASVEAQTYANHEVCLVDGGSRDGTLAIATGRPRLRVVRQRGSGLADAWNCGLEAARGSLVAFLDSDDRWLPDKLERQVQALRDRSTDCAISRMRFFLEPGLPIPPGFRADLLAGDHLAYMPSALLARRSVFERIGRFDTRFPIASDVDWFARLKDAGARVEVVPEVLVEKRVHDANLSTLGGAAFNHELVALLRDSVARRRESP
jgi:glycosyltransferase involved in cell wall biosynthesis